MQLIINPWSSRPHPNDEDTSPDESSPVAGRCCTWTPPARASRRTPSGCGPMKPKTFNSEPESRVKSRSECNASNDKKVTFLDRLALFDLTVRILWHSIEQLRFYSHLRESHMRKGRFYIHFSLFSQFMRLTEIKEVDHGNNGQQDFFQKKVFTSLDGELHASTKKLLLNAIFGFFPREDNVQRLTKLHS